MTALHDIESVSTILSLCIHADTNSCASLGLADDVTHEKEMPHRFKLQVSYRKYYSGLRFARFL